jgi:hypothetical protein
MSVLKNIYSGMPKISDLNQVVYTRNILLGFFHRIYLFLHVPLLKLFSSKAASYECFFLIEIEIFLDIFGCSSVINWDLTLFIHSFSQSAPKGGFDGSVREQSISDRHSGETLLMCNNSCSKRSLQSI